MTATFEHQKNVRFYHVPQLIRTFSLDAEIPHPAGSLPGIFWPHPFGPDCFKNLLGSKWPAHHKTAENF
jgi:hypothetical protein